MVNVLLLNASFEPLAIVKLGRAIGLLMDGKVDLVESVPDRELRSKSVRQPMPSVLRLRYYVNVPRRGVGWSRRGVLARDHHTEINVHRLQNAAHGRGDLGQPVLVERDLGVALDAFGDAPNRRLRHLDAGDFG